MLDLTVIILTKNEERHIARCLENVALLEPKQVLVIDSNSTDKTIELSEENGAEVITHTWTGTQAKQFNWALENCNLKGEWILRLDADEYLSENLIKEIKTILTKVSDDISAFSMRRYVIWQGKLIRHGMNPVILLRLFRKGYGKSNNALMDEHIVISSGKCQQLQYEFFDHNLNGISAWIEKHNDYAAREARQTLQQQSSSKGGNYEGSPNKNIKRLYAKMPLYWRGIFYFLYRYIAKGGFLDGRQGFTWHFLQACWYRILVDCKIEEIKREKI